MTNGAATPGLADLYQLGEQIELDKSASVRACVSAIMRLVYSAMQMMTPAACCSGSAAWPLSVAPGPPRRAG